MTKALRLAGMIATFLIVTLMSLSGAVWAGPSRQGTVPTGVTTEVERPGQCNFEDIELVLNTSTGTVFIPCTVIPIGGRAKAIEATFSEFGNLADLPIGLNFLSNGLTLLITDAKGRPVVFFTRGVSVCFPQPPSRKTVIRQWDQKFHRWVAFPTGRVGTLVCTPTRLNGLYVPVGR